MALGQNTELLSLDVKVRLPKYARGKDPIDYESILEDSEFGWKVEEPPDVDYVYVVVKPQDQDALFALLGTYNIKSI